MNNLNGIQAALFLSGLQDVVRLLKKDNTDKMWSYKIRSRSGVEFAFDPKTKTTLNIRLDRTPPTISGVTKVESIAGKRFSTALNRVFSGGVHNPKYKATIETEAALMELINHFLH